MRISDFDVFLPAPSAASACCIPQCPSVRLFPTALTLLSAATELRILPRTPPRDPQLSTASHRSGCELVLLRQCPQVRWRGGTAASRAPGPLGIRSRRLIDSTGLNCHSHLDEDLIQAFDLQAQWRSEMAALRGWCYRASGHPPSASWRRR